MDEEIGSIEAGKRADLILVGRGHVHQAPDPDPWSTIVYASRGSDVRLTMVDGEILARDFALVHQDVKEIAAGASAAAAALGV
jgi:5-methylthioadenosine/S-adenosylhomocysteine deaminase